MVQWLVNDQVVRIHWTAFCCKDSEFPWIPHLINKSCDLLLHTSFILPHIKLVSIQYPRQSARNIQVCVSDNSSNHDFKPFAYKHFLGNKEHVTKVLLLDPRESAHCKEPVELVMLVDQLFTGFYWTRLVHWTAESKPGRVYNLFIEGKWFSLKLKGVHLGQIDIEFFCASMTLTFYEFWRRDS